ncbi:anti-sigma factor antagonist [Psychrobacillus soli]|uniref:Anti-sigma factor antagonist n=1 Tax=Psychrobacillus soli TaxID=1543965 RepID=A0A544SNQ0_9BACI|nr:anti-sigma factor antagonist [Psychrobacillus soli]TQR06819.1 anti-sigma factor antagonist [Psychrobacillus soli]
MNISVELHQKDLLVVNGIIKGEIDAFTAPILREKLSEIDLKENLQVNIDLTDVSYMDSTGLGVFVGFYKSINASNGHMELIGLSSRLKRLFDITGLGEIMDIQASSGEVKIDETV